MGVPTTKSGKRYPQYDHCAVIVAEDITSRFLNVIGLFNGFIPLIAIQVKAYKFDDRTALVFTKVLDEMTLGFEEDEENEIEQISTNREFWTQKKASNETVQIADKILGIVNDLSPGHEFRYTKVNIRLSVNGQHVPYIIIKPRRKNHIVLIIRTTKNDEIDKLVEDNDLDDMGYMARGTKYRIRISNQDVNTKKEAIKEIVKLAERKYND